MGRYVNSTHSLTTLSTIALDKEKILKKGSVNERNR
jgi:hypothetical protein